MSPMRRATSQGANRVGRLRTEKLRTSKISGKISPISGASSTILPVGRNRSVRSSIRRSEEHTSELQSLMRISYAVFCLKKKQYQQYEEHVILNRHSQIVLSPVRTEEINT